MLVCARCKCILITFTMPPKPKKLLGLRGKVINSQGRQIISNLTKFMEKEAEDGLQIPLENFRERVMAAAGISNGTYYSIKREAQRIEKGEISSFSTPHEERPRKSRISDDVLVSQLEYIRQTIYDFYIVHKKTPTLECMLQKLQDSEFAFSGSKVTLWRVLKKVGFRWRNTEDHRKVVIESSDIRLKRISFLKKITRYRKEGRYIVYADEKYLHSSYSAEKGNSTGKDQRLIIGHAGGENGFIHNGLMIFQSGSKSGNYQGHLNHNNFIKWVRTQLLPNLPPLSVLILSNANHHNSRVEDSITSASTKRDMTDWLNERKIPFDKDLTKPELFNVIKVKKHGEGVVQFKLDELLDDHGHAVLRLPPFHPELSPIEEMWTLVKSWVAAHNVTFKLADVERLVRERLDAITPEDWQRLCTNVVKKEQEWIGKEHLFDDAIDNITFLDTGDATSAGESEEGEDDDGDMFGVDFVSCGSFL